MKLLDKLFKKLVSNIEDVYWLPMPFKMQHEHKELLKSIADTYEDLCQMIDNDDLMFKTMSELGFAACEEHYDFRACIARGKVCPDATDAVTVEYDATLWMNEQLQKVQPVFIAYDCVGTIEVIARYEANRDVVVFFMRPILMNDIDEFERLLPTARFISNMFIAFVLSTCSLAALCLYLSIRLAIA